MLFKRQTNRQAAESRFALANKPASCGIFVRITSYNSVVTCAADEARDNQKSQRIQPDTLLRQVNLLVRRLLYSCAKASIQIVASLLMRVCHQEKASYRKYCKESSLCLSELPRSRFFLFRQHIRDGLHCGYQGTQNASPFGKRFQS